MWPDGELFGTICIFDSRDNAQATQFEGLVAELRELIERDMQMIINSYERENLLSEISQHRCHLQEMVEAQTAELARSNEVTEELLRFEQLVSDLVARFVNLPPEDVDKEITESFDRLCQFFGVDGSALFSIVAENKQIRILNTGCASTALPPFVERITSEYAWENPRMDEERKPIIFQEEDIPAEDTTLNGPKTSLLLLPIVVGRHHAYLFGLWAENARHEWPQVCIHRLRLLGEIFAKAIRARDQHEALVKSEKGLAAAQRIAHLGSWEWDIPGDIHHWSDGFYRIFGFSPQELSASYERFLASVHPEDRQAVHQANTECLSNPGRAYSLEYRVVCPDGTERIVHAQAEVLFDQNGKAVRMIGTIQDITDRKRAEEALARSESKYRELVQNANSAILRWNRDGSITFANEYAQTFFGYSSDELIGTSVSIIVPKQDSAGTDLSTLVQDVVDNPEHYINILNENVCRDGRRVWMTWTNKPIFDENGKVAEILAIGTDITELKRAKQALEDAFDKIKKLKEQLEAENIYLREEMGSRDGYGEIIGTSVPIKFALGRARQVARTKTTVLLTGETGTGKGMFARFIHQESDRRNKPFVNVNCAGLPANLIESELFGREKGAFTGSTARQIGRFELANGGTIFLDEIGELALELQAKLLKVIEEGEFERLGSPHTVKVDVRIIASTNRHLEEEIKKGRFRQDLFYRLNVFPVIIPPLRERSGDIQLLVETYVTKFSRSHNKEIKRIPKRIMEWLVNYAWPGNVRELIHVVERAVIVSEGPELRLAETIQAPSVDSAREVETGTMESRETKALAQAEREHILRTLQETGWRIEGPRGAARLLEMHPNTLRARMKKLGIKRPGS
ncbi:sigma 54-interacting transcriptional regulator [Desulforhabdus sp. TSK]|uniref:sigma 54-interacting transcriptional regulator n=1 Tax=Desulforhabdus sp. TSK TaxID=2925014 RepID=UPI001FC880A7|nr:sigma 54-interacting transcriptional regulator [Desulforhabdus sp. TSK]GKT10976.1 hypothetical protein DSTSK_42810 [Desulforhabdus sp. TSK]